MFRIVTQQVFHLIHKLLHLRKYTTNIVDKNKESHKLQDYGKDSNNK